MNARRHPHGCFQAVKRILCEHQVSFARKVPAEERKPDPLLLFRTIDSRGDVAPRAPLVTH
jgi:hypothetical protein